MNLPEGTEWSNKNDTPTCKRTEIYIGNNENTLRFLSLYKSARWVVVTQFHRLPFYYDGELVNRTQMYVKRKTYDIRIEVKTFISRHILHQHWLIHLSHRFTNASKPATYKSFYCYLIHFRTSVSTSSSLKCLQRFSTQLWTAASDKHFQP
jgi:hypothetical protein